MMHILMNQLTAKCRRPACTRKAKTQYGYCRAHADALGLEIHLVDSATTFQIIESLLKDGWTFYAIGAEAGLSRHGIKRAYDNQTKHIRAITRDKIATLRGKLPPNVHLLLPTQRRLQSLQAAGFTQSELAAGIGVSQSTLSKVMSGTRSPAPIAGAVMQFYDEKKTEPVRKPASAAKGKPWPPPMWWDDIDDPDEQPGINYCLDCHIEKDPTPSYYCASCRGRRWREAAKQKAK